MCARQDDPTQYDHNPMTVSVDAEELPPEYAHADCDHPRMCQQTGRPLPGFGPDGPFVDVSRSRSYRRDVLTALETAQRFLVWTLEGASTLVEHDDYRQLGLQLALVTGEARRLARVHGRLS